MIKHNTRMWKIMSAVISNKGDYPFLVAHAFQFLAFLRVYARRNKTRQIKNFAKKRNKFKTKFLR